MRFEDACRSVALRRGVDWTGRYIRLGDETIHYVEAGQGDPLLLIHGFLAWSYTWRKNLPALAERFHTLAPDLRGLVLVAPSALVVRRRHRAERWLLPLPLLGPLTVRMALLNRRFAARTVREAYYRQDQVTPADIEGYLLPAAIPGTARTFTAMLRQLDFGAAASRLAEIPHRTLLIWGADDPWVPMAHAHRIASQMERCELVIFPHCGHVPHEEHPDRFHQLVIPFLSAL